MTPSAVTHFSKVTVTGSGGESGTLSSGVWGTQSSLYLAGPGSAHRALALNCSAPINDRKGAEAKDWRSGKPVRVVRNVKGRKHSKYAPAEGNRYDGIYKVSGHPCPLRAPAGPRMVPTSIVLPHRS